MKYVFLNNVLVGPFVLNLDNTQDETKVDRTWFVGKKAGSVSFEWVKKQGNVEVLELTEEQYNKVLQEFDDKWQANFAKVLKKKAEYESPFLKKLEMQEAHYKKTEEEGALEAKRQAEVSKEFAKYFKEKKYLSQPNENKEFWEGEKPQHWYKGGGYSRLENCKSKG